MRIPRVLKWVGGFALGAGVTSFLLGGRDDELDKPTPEPDDPLEPGDEPEGHEPEPPPDPGWQEPPEPEGAPGWHDDPAPPEPETPDPDPFGIKG
jgi:hypothetical protein